MHPVILAFARLTRPANLPTAAADILAGAAIAGIIPATLEALPIAANTTYNLLYLVSVQTPFFYGGTI